MSQSSSTQPSATEPRRAMIRVTGLTKSFGDVAVLKGVTFEVAESEIFVLLGGSGSGKTVLMKHLEGLLTPDAGSIEMCGHELTTLDAEGLQDVRRQLGIAFQSGALFDSMTVAENVAFPLKEQLHLPTAEVAHRVAETLALVGLKDVASALPGSLSGGMRKRLAFARALILKPRVLLADEPTAGLDPLTTEVVDDAIIAAQKSLGLTAFLITHDLPTAFRIADRVALLHDGQVIEAAPPAVFLESKHPAVRAFLKDWLSREQQARAL